MAQTLDYNKVVTTVVPMPVPTFDEDMAIIQKLDDEPNDVGGLTASELKAEFDSAGERVKKYINQDLIPAVLAEDMTEEARVAAEAERVANEIERVANENARNVWEPYDSSKAYVPGNKVSYNGSSYRNIKACSSVVPTNSTYWMLIAARGEDGEGSGDMLEKIYDPQKKRTDIFRYVDQLLEGIGPGADGEDGKDGADGVGVPAGGTAGQVLAKKSGTDYDTEWVTPEAGGTAVNVDATLSVSGAAADAKATGEKIGAVEKTAAANAQSIGTLQGRVGALEEKATGINFTNWESGGFVVTMSDGTQHNGTVTFDSEGKPTSVTLNGHTLSITLPA